METELGGVCHLVQHGPAITAVLINPSLKQTLPLIEAEGTGHRHDDSPADGLPTETSASLMSCALHASQREAAAG